MQPISLVERNPKPENLMSNDVTKTEAAVDDSVQFASLEYATMETEKFKRFLRGVGGNLNCPSCSQNQWNFEAGPNEQYSAGVPFEARQPPLRKDESTLTNFVPVYILTCMNCGFVRLHNRDVVGRWVELQDKAEKE
jgi:hypothetical protein